MLHDLTIYQKSQDFLTWIYPVLSKLPRSEKYSLGKRMEDILVEILEGIITANYQIEKMESLAVLRVKMDSLQAHIRISKNLGVITRKQYELSSRAINELKRLLLGWMKSGRKGSPKIRPEMRRILSVLWSKRQNINRLPRLIAKFTQWG